MLLERISLAGIARAVVVSDRWLQTYVNDKYATVPREIEVTQKKDKLTIQCDELWSFVDNKGNKQWVWLALDAKTREIVGVYIGDWREPVRDAELVHAANYAPLFRAERNRNEQAARKLWESLPPVYRQCAVAYTDFWSAYGAVFPSQPHQAVGKETGLTSYIERFNNTLRQRVSRLVRKTLSFSKSFENQALLNQGMKIKFRRFKGYIQKLKA